MKELFSFIGIWLLGLAKTVRKDIFVSELSFHDFYENLLWIKFIKHLANFGTHVSINQKSWSYLPQSKLSWT